MLPSFMIEKLFSLGAIRVRTSATFAIDRERGRILSASRSL